jgi:multidrug resistance efflux pump
MVHDTLWQDATDGSEPAVPFRRRGDVRVSEISEDGGANKQYYFKVPTTGEVFQLGPEEYFLFKQLNGKRSFTEIRKRFHANFACELPRQHFDTLLRDFFEMQVVERSSGGGAAGAGMSDAPDVKFDDLSGSAAADRDDGHAETVTATRKGLFAEEPAASERPSRARAPGQLHLFNPTKLLAALNWLFWPLRYFTWLLIPGTLVGGLIIMHRFWPLQLDLHLMVQSYSVLAPLLISLFTVNLVSRIVQGMVIQRYGGKVESFGVILLFGLMPRFYIDRSGAKSLSRRGRLWSHGAPLLTRLGFFAVGAFVWAANRQSGTVLSEVALMISQMGLWAFVITAIPLFRFDGYFWLANLFERPYLREQAYKLLGLHLRARAPEAMSGKDKWALTFFALGCIIATAALMVTCVLYIGIILEERFQGTGVMVFLSLFAVASLWLLAIRGTIKRIVADKQSGQGQQNALVPVPQSESSVVPLNKYRELTVSNRSHDLALPGLGGLPYRTEKPKRSYVPLMIWGSLAGALAIVAFLPYEYETGGEFHILPQQRIEVRARVSGELVEILADEGDWVEEGEIIGKVSNWDEKRDLAVTIAELDRAKANLESLQNSPVKEEVELAQRRVENAGAKIPFAKAQAERAAKLIEKGAISDANAEALRSEYDQALTELAVARANLELVKTGPMKSEIDAAKAEVARLTEERRFREDEFERTQLRATATGRIVTKNLQLQKGNYLNVGDLLAEIEDHRVARAEIDVPESDIGQVQIGDTVRLKAWAYSDFELPGNVVAIAPIAEEREYGLVVRVMTNIPNDDGLLKPKMTGYGKIHGSSMPVWEAYSRMIMRFFRIEIWSWIP